MVLPIAYLSELEMLNEKLHGVERTSQSCIFVANREKSLGAGTYADALDRVMSAIIDIKDVQRNTNEW